MELVPYSDPNSTSTTPPWQDMFRSATTRKPDSDPSPPPEPNPNTTQTQTSDPELRLALYIAMAHAGFAFAFFVLVALSKLLQDFLRPMAMATITCNTFHGFYSRPVKFFPALKPLFYSFLPLTCSTFEAMLILFLV